MELHSILARSPLFLGMAPGDMDAILGCLSARRRSFQRHQFLLRAGEPCTDTGLVLAGSVLIVKEDVWGGRAILAQAGPGDLFGESYAVPPGQTLEVSAVAAEEGEVLLLDTGRLLCPCERRCPFHQQMILSLLGVLAQKNRALSRKMDHLARRTTREKVLSYLSDLSVRAGRRDFTIPFDRQQLADYLSVDRSALSAVLGALKREGVLDFHKDRFRLL